MTKLCVYYVYCVCMLYNVYIVYIMCNANLCQVCVSVTLLLMGLFTIHRRSSCFLTVKSLNARCNRTQVADLVMPCSQIHAL